MARRRVHRHLRLPTARLRPRKNNKRKSVTTKETCRAYCRQYTDASRCFPRLISRRCTFGREKSRAHPRYGARCHCRRCRIARPRGRRIKRRDGRAGGVGRERFCLRSRLFGRGGNREDGMTKQESESCWQWLRWEIEELVKGGNFFFKTPHVSARGAKGLMVAT